VFDLDRTLITSSSATVFRKHLAEHGLGGGHDLPLVDVFTKFYEQFGETWLLMQPARLSSRAATGGASTVDAAMQDAAEELATMLLPGAAKAIESTGPRAAPRDGDHLADGVREAVRRPTRLRRRGRHPSGSAATTARRSPGG
jgi:hypothetical protein